MPISQGRQLDLVLQVDGVLRSGDRDPGTWPADRDTATLVLVDVVDELERRQSSSGGPGAGA